MEDVEALCKRVVIINHGQLIFDGLLDNLLKKHINSKELEVTFSEKIDVTKLKKIGKIKERTLRRAIIEVPKEKSKQAAIELLNNFPVEDILINEISVDEVIRRIFK